MQTFKEGDTVWYADRSAQRVIETVVAKAEDEGYTLAYKNRYSPSEQVFENYESANYFIKNTL